MSAIAELAADLEKISGLSMTRWEKVVALIRREYDPSAKAPVAYDMVPTMSYFESGRLLGILFSFLSVLKLHSSKYLSCLVLRCGWFRGCLQSGIW